MGYNVRYIINKRYHILGTHDFQTTEFTDCNYIQALLYYRKGEGYICEIRPVGRYIERGILVTVTNHNYPGIEKCTVPCSRRSKKREEEAIFDFKCNLFVRIIRELGYDIDSTWIWE